MFFAQALLSPLFELGILTPCKVSTTLAVRNTIGQIMRDLNASTML